MRSANVVLFTAVLFLAISNAALVADSPFGADFIRTGGFEAMGKENVPDGWTFIVEPATAGNCSLDPVNAFAGKTSVKLSSAGKGAMYFRSRPVPLPKERTGCLFGFEYRTQGFQVDSKAYSGISASLGLQFLDAQGHGVAPSDDIGLPYSDKPWTSCFRLISPFPRGATQVMVIVAFANDSEKTVGKLLPATLWLDSLQLLSYAPPANVSPQRVQEFGFGKGSLLQAGVGKLSSDAQATGGSAATGATPQAKGVLLDSPAYASAGPGLYRAILRCKVADAAKSAPVGLFSLGPLDGMYAVNRSLMPDMFAGGSYSDLTMDFFLPSDAKWCFHLELAGTQAIWVDTLRVQKLVAMKVAMPGSLAAENAQKAK